MVLYWCKDRGLSPTNPIDRERIKVMCYWVKYKMHSAAEVQGICVVAHSKAKAYEIAVYEDIPP